MTPRVALPPFRDAPCLLVPKLLLGNPVRKLPLPGIHPRVGTWKLIDYQAIGSIERPCNQLHLIAKSENLSRDI